MKKFNLKFYGSLGLMSGLVFFGGGPPGHAGGRVVAWGFLSDVPDGLTNVVALAAGDAHGLALRADGSLAAWGDNSSGQANVPAGLSQVVAIAAGGSQSLVLKADGTVVAWGNSVVNGWPRPSTVPGGLRNVVAIAVGLTDSLALKGDGTMMVWGYNMTFDPAGLTNVVAIAAGRAHNLALTADGTVIAWGDNAYGETNVPPSLSNVVAIAAGGAHNLALINDGTVVAWGNNSSGQTNVPAGLTKVVAIAAGGGHSLALKDDGTVVAWGDNSFGQTNIPAGLTNVTTIAAGDLLCLALVEGAPWIWEPPTNQTAYTGNTVVFKVRGQGALPVHYQWQSHGTNLAGATQAVFRIENLQFTDGGIYAVVLSNSFGSVTSAPALLTVREGPPVILAPPAVQKIALDGQALVQLTVAGSWPLQYQWRFQGMEVPGATQATLVLPPGMARPGPYSVIVSNAFGVVTSANALLNFRRVVANWFGQTNDPSGLLNVVEVAAGVGHCLALKEDGTVVGWGSNYGPNGSNEYYGQAVVPEGLTNVVAIAAGAYHSVALKSDGTLAAWGDNTSRQTEIPPGLSNVVAIAASEYHSIALKSDGGVVAWGRIYYYDDLQNNVLASLSDLVAIAAGSSTDLALRSDGTLIASEYSSSYLCHWWLAARIPDAVAIAVTSDGAYSYDRRYAVLKSDGTTVEVAPSSFGHSISPVDTNVVAFGKNGGVVKADGTVTASGEMLAGLTNVVALGSALNYRYPPANQHYLALVGDGSPWITIPPVSKRAYVGSTVILDVKAAGDRPLNYQWQLNGHDLVAATNATLVLSNVQAAQTGPYQVVVHNPSGSITSAIACLTVLPARVVGWGSDSNYHGFAGQTVIPPGLTNVVAVAAGGSHSVALRADGGVVAWGDNRGGQTEVPVGLTQVVAVAAGGAYSLALKEDGTVLAWGDNVSGQINVLVGLTNTVAIAAGESHSLALKEDGTVVAWGDNDVGQTNVPARLANIVAIAAGVYHSLALQSDGRVVGWGLCVSSGPTNVVAIAAGGFHSLALKGDGTVVAWGNNFYGQTNVPTGLADVVAIAAGGNHSLALKADGTVLAWGDNSSGQTNVPVELTNAVAIAAGGLHSLAIQGELRPVILGSLRPRTAYTGKALRLSFAAMGTMPLSYQWYFNGTPLPGATNGVLALTNARLTDTGSYSLVVSNALGVVASSNVAVVVNEGPPVILVSPAPQSAFVGGTAIFYTSADGSMPLNYQWQFNGADIPGATSPDLTLRNVILAQAGQYSVIISNAWGAVTSAAAPLHVGLVAAWGVTWGVNAYDQTNVPVGLTNVVAMAAGAYHNLALKSDGSLVAWGDNSSGQTNIPAGLTNVVAMAAGGSYNLALKSDGTVVAWGYNGSGQTNIPAGLTGVVAIAAGWSHSLALKSNGTVVAWGYNGSGQTNIPAGLTDAVAITAGGAHSLALKGNGTVVAWGANSSGQTNIPAGLTGVVAIGAAGSLSLALTGDGTVVAWGSQTNVPAGLTNVVAIAAGNPNLALQSDGMVVEWSGNYYYGQTRLPAGLIKAVAIAAGANHHLALVGEGPLPPWISSPVRVGNRFSVAVPTGRGKAYRLEYKESLMEANWVMRPPVAGDGTVKILTDPAASRPYRFYRVRVQQ